MSVVRKDVLVAGGYPRGRSKNVEIFLWKEEKWFESAKMKIGHWAASSFVYNDNLFVVGGCDFNSTEILNLNRHPLTWQTFPEELPFKIFSHKTVVYKEQVLYIGGYNEDKQKTSDMISELQITGTPFPVLKELCHMPEPLFDHGAEVVGDKVLIFGGNGKDEKALSNVSEFDPRTLTFKKMPPLPHPLTRMATVRWRDQVVLLGGVHSCSSNSVIMYDSSTGKTTILPPMLEKRERGCAVLTGNAIVVIGGDNDKGKQLKSVEYFEMGRSSSWSYLPSMIEPRSRAIAEMLPLGNVYV
ncbi:gigaxonin-like [Xenia sp. Carnegie-2017]|uniref:gigaxonin-like n=1 Tax=Xenia sp. Carnegie-2017 TaxID=2897299 RepID=UPI001F0503FD|nr:gigaxonin-like [Xenia sp. Carnegie-2017]